ncbi:MULTISPECIES: peptidoglycan DD-metalloendopeptidase family protein [unclassified Rudaea]|uniref:OapA family protein n=1 Tax=unclassified Rudaea TaxID=2627037 RepID=UPI0020168362|nr:MULTISPECIES: peptidoglycan DD-metalloendopeptidase family protein [unclassified Rudaea]
MNLNNNDSGAQGAPHSCATRIDPQNGVADISTDAAKWTFIQNLAKSPLSWRRRHVVLAGAIVAVLIAAGATIPTWAVAMRDSGSVPRTTLDLPLPTLSPEDAALSAALDHANSDPLTDDSAWQVVKVKSGQTLADIFQQQGLNATDLARLLDEPGNASCLRSIHPGDEFAFLNNDDGSLRAIRFDRDDRTRVIASFRTNGIKQIELDRNVERRTQVARGVIDSSLFGAGEEAGLSDAMVLKLANAFGYDIDFAQDLRQGDSFTVIYDDVYREGERLRDGDIIAATFVNKGKRYSAFRFTNSAGETSYYSAEGRPLKKSFLRTPLDFTRITSFFSVARMHPILGTMRAHKGVDYAAPQGTPIRAAGDGKIAFRGWQPGYGNVVIVQHNAHNTTLYGHMSRFGNAQVGQHVGQGQTIGYVGMTGLATGPHLHYEFRIDGQHRNPLTVTTLPPEPLPGAELARFRSQTQSMLARLNKLEATQLASAK